MHFDTANKVNRRDFSVNAHIFNSSLCIKQAKPPSATDIWLSSNVYIIMSEKHRYAVGIIISKILFYFADQD